MLASASFDLDFHRQELFRAGTRVALPRKVLEVLLILIEKPGEIVTRECLRARLWPPDQNVNFDANVNTTVNKLRQVLGDSTNQPSLCGNHPASAVTFLLLGPNTLTSRLRPESSLMSRLSPKADSFPRPLSATQRFILDDKVAQILHCFFLQSVYGFVDCRDSFWVPVGFRRPPSIVMAYERTLPIGIKGSLG